MDVSPEKGFLLPENKSRDVFSGEDENRSPPIALANILHSPAVNDRIKATAIKRLSAVLIYMVLHDISWLPDKSPGSSHPLRKVYFSTEYKGTKGIMIGVRATYSRYSGISE